MSTPKFLGQRRLWLLFNQDTFEALSGDFEAVDLTEEPEGAEWSETFALNSAAPISAFLRGTVETLSFVCRLFDDSILPIAVPTRLKADKVMVKYEKLKSWSKRDELLGRPPILIFTAGAGEIAQRCKLTSIGSARFDDLGVLGEVKGVTCSLNLSRYIPYDIETAATAPPETRYHRARTGDFYELLAKREYGNALLGVLIRNRHPSQRRVEEGDVVRLPSYEAIADEPIRPTSVALRGLTGSVLNPQRQLRAQVLKRLAERAAGSA